MDSKSLQAGDEVTGQSATDVAGASPEVGQTASPPERKWTPEEQAANRRLWVEALRSGKYKQGRTYLRSIDGLYCCLGIACDLLKEPLNLGWSPDGGRYVVADPSDPLDPHVAGLPPSVMDALGLRGPWGEITPGDSLAQRNDGGASFPEIADVIENPPAGLLVETRAQFAHDVTELTAQISVEDALAAAVAPVLISSVDAGGDDSSGHDLDDPEPPSTVAPSDPPGVGQVERFAWAEGKFEARYERDEYGELFVSVWWEHSGRLWRTKVASCAVDLYDPFQDDENKAEAEAIAKAEFIAAACNYYANPPTSEGLKDNSGRGSENNADGNASNENANRATKPLEPDWSDQDEDGHQQAYNVHSVCCNSYIYRTHPEGPAMCGECGAENPKWKEALCSRVHTSASQSAGFVTSGQKANRGPTVHKTINAFPCTSDAERCGMTLRDYAAVHVLPAVYEYRCEYRYMRAESDQEIADYAATTSYQLADAMLKARETEG